MYIPTYADVEAAHTRILPYIHRTPVLTSSYINGMAGAELFFKCENFQKAAAILRNPQVFKGQRVGVIITGGNVDLDKLPWM